MIRTHSNVLTKKTRPCLVAKGDSFSDAKKNVIEINFESLRKRKNTLDNDQFWKFQEIFKNIQNLQSTKQEEQDKSSLSPVVSALIKIQNKSLDDWKKAINQIGKTNKLNQRDNIQQLFNSWDELDDEQEQIETLKIIQSLEGTSI